MLVQCFLELGARIGVGVIRDFLNSVSRPGPPFLLGASGQHELQRPDALVLGLMCDAAVCWAGLLVAVIERCGHSDSMPIPVPVRPLLITTALALRTPPSQRESAASYRARRGQVASRASGSAIRTIQAPQ